MSVDARIKVIAENLTAEVFSKVQTELQKMGTVGEQANVRIKDSSKQSTSSISDMIGTVGGLGAAVGIGFGVAEVVSFGKSIMADVDALMRMHDQTGVTLQGLQKFQIAGDDAGNSLDQITGAITKMEDKLSSGDSGALGALNKLHIPFEDIKNLSPENQFIAISDAIRQVKDPAQQVQIAIDLFGKSGAQVLPTLKRGFDDVKDGAVGMSDETIAAIDEAGDMFTSLGRKAKGFAAEATVGFVHWVQDGLDPSIHAVNELKREAEALHDQLQKMGDAIPQAPMRMVEELPKITSESPAVQRALKEIEEAQRKAAKAAEDHAAAIKKLHEQVRDLEDVKVGKVDFGFEIEDQTINQLREFLALRKELNGLPVDGVRQLQSDLRGVGEVASAAGDAFLVDFVGPIQDLEQTLPSLHSQFADMFSDLKSFVSHDLGNLIVGAFQGGGDVGKTIGSGLGKQLGEGLASALQGPLQDVLGKTLGSAMGSFLGPLGALGGSLLGKGIDALFHIGGPSKAELAGRDVEAAFERGFGGFDQMMQKVGDAYAATGRSSQQAQADVKAMLDAEKHGAKATEDAISRINNVLDEQKTKAAEVAAEQEAAEEEADARRKQIFEEGNKALDDLDNRRKSLADAISQEAPEEVMGVIETGMRAQLQTLNEQAEQQRKDLAEQAQAAGMTLEDALSNIHPDPVHVAIVWDAPALPGGEAPEPVPGHADGGVFATEHIARIAEGGQPEIVGNVDFMTRALTGAMNRVSGGRTGFTQGQLAELGDMFRNANRQLSRDLTQGLAIAFRDAMLLAR